MSHWAYIDDTKGTLKTNLDDFLIEGHIYTLDWYIEDPEKNGYIAKVNGRIVKFENKPLPIFRWRAKSEQSFEPVIAVSEIKPATDM